MASTQKLTKHRKKNAAKINTTFETSGTDSTSVEDKLFGQTTLEDDEDSDEGPVVFICGKCKLPVGDSVSWDGWEDGQSQIRLKRVTENVVVGKENRLYEISKHHPCIIQDILCRGCDSKLGMVYASTPKSMDHKRFAFFLNVQGIESYVLGSSSQMLAAEGPKEQLVTLEYRGIVEEQLTELKVLVFSMAQRLESIEAGLQE